MPPVSLQKNLKSGFVGATCLMLIGTQSASAFSLRKLIAQSEKGANSMTEPKLILRTGIDLCETGLSPNSIQLADVIGISPLLRNISTLRKQVESSSGEPTIDKLSARQDLWDDTLKAALIIQRANLEVDFTLAEIDVEQEIYA